MAVQSRAPDWTARRPADPQSTGCPPAGPRAGAPSGCARVGRGEDEGGRRGKAAACGAAHPTVHQQCHAGGHAGGTRVGGRGTRVGYRGNRITRRSLAAACSPVPCVSDSLRLGCRTRRVSRAGAAGTRTPRARSSASSAEAASSSVAPSAASSSSRGPGSARSAAGESRGRRGRPPPLRRLPPLQRVSAGS